MLSAGLDFLIDSFGFRVVFPLRIANTILIQVNAIHYDPPLIFLLTCGTNLEVLGTSDSRDSKAAQESLLSFLARASL